LHKQAGGGRGGARKRTRREIINLLVIREIINLMMFFSALGLEKKKKKMGLETKKKKKKEEEEEEEEGGMAGVIKVLNHPQFPDQIRPMSTNQASWRWPWGARKRTRREIVNLMMIISSRKTQDVRPQERAINEKFNGELSRVNSELTSVGL